MTAENESIADSRNAGDGLTESVSQPDSRNALDEHEAGMSSRLVGLVLTDMALKESGVGRIIFPVLEHGHAKVRLSDGETISIPALMFRARWRRILTATCEGCGKPLGWRRMDTRYCSNACRQRAYRRRRSSEVVASDSAAT